MNLLKKLKDNLGIPDGEIYTIKDEEYLDSENKDEKVIRPNAFNFKENKYSSPSIEKNDKNDRDNSNLQQLSITKPESFDEALKVAQDLLKGNIIILNAEALEFKEAQRFLDFLSGSAFAIGGEVTEVNDKIFIISPKNVNVNEGIKKLTSLKNLLNL